MMSTGHLRRATRDPQPANTGFPFQVYKSAQLQLRDEAWRATPPQSSSNVASVIHLIEILPVPDVRYATTYAVVPIGPSRLSKVSVYAVPPVRRG
jgi:hypothetical protein